MRPALFFGNNPISLAGGAITSAAGVTMIGYWLVELFGRPDDNPYLGIIFFLILPALFILGLLLIPVGVFPRRRKLQAGGTDSSRVSQDRSQRSHVPSRPRHRSGRHHRQPAAWCRLPAIAASAYMDSPQFCGQSCHVMHPEYTAYKVSAHSHVDCVACHIGSGAEVSFQSQGQWHQAAHRSHDQSLSHADSFAGAEPAPGARNLRGMPHAGQVRRRKTARQIQLRRRRKEHRDAKRGRPPSRRPRLALTSQRHPRRSPRPHRIHRHRSHTHHHSLGAERAMRDGSTTDFATQASKVPSPRASAG